MGSSRCSETIKTHAIFAHNTLVYSVKIHIANNPRKLNTWMDPAEYLAYRGDVDGEALIVDKRGEEAVEELHRHSAAAKISAEALSGAAKIPITVL